MFAWSACRKLTTFQYRSSVGAPLPQGKALVHIVCQKFLHIDGHHHIAMMMCDNASQVMCQIFFIPFMFHIWIRTYLVFAFLPLTLVTTIRQNQYARTALSYANILAVLITICILCKVLAASNAQAHVQCIFMYCNYGAGVFYVNLFCMLWSGWKGIALQRSLWNRAVVAVHRWYCKFNHIYVCLYTIFGFVCANSYSAAPHMLPSYFTDASRVNATYMVFSLNAERCQCVLASVRYARSFARLHIQGAYVCVNIGEFDYNFGGNCKL